MPLLAEVRVWSWEAESAFMEATQILSAPHWTVSSSESIMLQIELGNEARGSWLRRIVQPCAITVPPASTETEWRQSCISRRRRKLDVAGGVGHGETLTGHEHDLARRHLLEVPLELLRGPLVEKEAGSAEEGSWISRRWCLSEAATSRRRASKSEVFLGGD